MDHNLLLRYLTEVGSGAWDRFRQAVRFLGGGDEEAPSPSRALTPSTVARHLSTLGHAEFAFGEHRRWAVGPPVLATLPGRESAGALCGARSERLEDLVGEQAGEVGVEVTPVSQDEGPDAFLLSALTSALLEQLADRAGVAVEHNVAGRIARCLPRLDDVMRLSPVAPEPSGHEISAYNASSLRWEEVPDSSGDGLYWHKHYCQPEYRLKLGDHCFRTTRYTGIHLWLRCLRRSVLSYDVESEELHVPVGAALPELHAKAAVLSSGMLPYLARVEGAARNVYRGVPVSIARSIMLSLGQS